MNTKYVVLTNQTPNNGSPLLICCHEVALKKKKKKKGKREKSLCYTYANDEH